MTNDKVFYTREEYKRLEKKLRSISEDLEKAKKDLYEAVYRKRIITENLTAEISDLKRRLLFNTSDLSLDEIKELTIEQVEEKLK